MDKYFEYIENIEKIIEREKTEGAENAEKASQLLFETIKNGKNIFLFGTGHSHMLAEELFYRAGGLVNIRPILEPSLMLHESASKSTEIERLYGSAEILIEHYGVKKGDCVIIISNSGRNAVPVDAALLSKSRGASVIALTSMEHTLKVTSRHKSEKRLFEIAHVVLDNMGEYGDASLKIDGFDGKICPTSTVIGTMLLNAIIAETVEKCVENGITPECFKSSNADGGDEYNEKLLEKYKGEIIHL